MLPDHPHCLGFDHRQEHTVGQYEDNGHEVDVDPGQGELSDQVVRQEDELGEKLRPLIPFNALILLGNPPKKMSTA